MNNLISDELKGYFFALLSALLFGLSTPLCKYLLNLINPWLLAGLLYLSAAFWLLIMLLSRHCVKKTPFNLAFKPGILKWICGSIFFGGLLGPILLLFGLANTNASTTALLLNFEGVFTIILAVTIFKEKVNITTAVGIMLIILGGVELVWPKDLNFNPSLELFLIIAACIAWAIDNNFTKKVSTEDPIILSFIKCSIAGVVNTTIGISLNKSAHFGLDVLMVTSMAGLICYASSLVFFILALRYIGAAKTSAYFSVAPFIGAICSVLFLKEPLSMQLLLASFLIGSGVFLHMRIHGYDKIKSFVASL